jgi:hypothetical protein
MASTDEDAMNLFIIPLRSQSPAVAHYNRSNRVRDPLIVRGNIADIHQMGDSAVRTRGSRFDE